MNNNNQRRCRGCHEIGHNIRGCIKNIDEQIILEYSRRTLMNLPTEFPLELCVSTANINKLCDKYGLAYRRVSRIDKLERLHRIYLQLGTEHRREHIIQNRRNINIYRPSYLPPPPLPNDDVPVQLGLYYNFSQMLNFREFRRQEQVVKKPSLQIVVDKTKFVEETDIGECPICYENCINMIATDCNHSYCQPCFNKLVNSVNKNTLPCPLCRENVKNIFVFSENSSDCMLKL
jgi:hypothetical protein